MNQNHKYEAQKFLAIASDFKLGELLTEKSHPKTKNLDTILKDDLAGAINVINEVDHEIIEILKRAVPQILSLKSAISETIKSGKKIFIAGCGSTGRLALTLEYLYHKQYPHRNDVISFMAGGDTALISSIESFEDHPEFAERHMEQLGFTNGDLLIGVSEGGETPFVIGAILHALKYSPENIPYFLYCNPDVLLKYIKRSDAIIQNSQIQKINLTTGPQALTGSTRMEASSILELVIGLALLSDNIHMDIINFEKLLDFDFSFLQKFIKKEAEIYKRGEYLFYDVDPKIAITILTDTTERSPTFSLSPFENELDETIIPSWCYLYFKEINNPKEAWIALLGRNPRALDWEEFPLTSYNRLLGFNFSSKIKKKRTKYCGRKKQHYFHIERKIDGIYFELDNIKYTFPFKEEESDLLLFVILKIILNTHSTLVMGLMGRYYGNYMTYVRPSCHKLIDRAVRYATNILKEKNIEVTYDDLVYDCFELKNSVDSTDSLVFKLVEFVVKKNS